MLRETLYFTNRSPLAPLRVVAMENCRPFMEEVNKALVAKRQAYIAEFGGKNRDVETRDYERDNYLIKAECPRFGSGEAKGVIGETVRGCDLFIVSDVTNHDLSFSISGRKHYMSPDDHYADLKRIISAAMTSAYRVSVIMPFLYESRQHKRTGRESLDCSLALNELANMGVANIITFDAHDPRVQNSIPLHDFDNYSPIAELLKVMESKVGDFKIDKEKLLIVSPDEGSMGRAVFLANNIGVNMSMFYRRRDFTRMENGENPVVAQEYLGTDVEGKTCVVLDDIVDTGRNMLTAARALKQMDAKRVVLCASFPLFNQGYERFDKAYEEGVFDYICCTNLIHRDEELLKKPWYFEADLSEYVATIIDTMNHGVAVSSIMTPNEKIREFLERHS